MGKRFLLHINADHAGLSRYLVAFVATAVAVLLRWLLDPWMGNSLPFVTLFGAIAIVVWHGGYRPALLAATLSYLAADYLFIESRGIIGYGSAKEVVGIVLYLLSCFLVIALGEQMRAARRRAEAGQQGILLKHRQLEAEMATRRRAEEKLQASEQWFRTLAGHAPIGIFRTDTEGNCLFVNDRWCETAGMTPDAAKGQGWAGALHPEDKDRVFQEWNTATKTGREFASGYRFRTPEGRVTWLSGRAVALRDEGGQISGYLGTITDITEQKKAAEELRQRAEENEKLMDLVPLGVFIAHDPACRRITGNRAGYELLRLPTGSNLSVTPPPGEEPPFTARRGGRPLSPDELPMQQAAAHGVEVRDVEVEHVYPDGTTHTLFGSASPLFDAQGKVRGCVASFLDITQLKRAEQALKDADHRKDEFLATLAHELRNPLAPLRNALELLRRAGDNARLIEHGRSIMERQVSQIVRLVDDLLDISRITRGNWQLRKERADLADVLNAAIETARPLIEGSNHELTVTLPPQPVPVQADPIRLAQAFANLLNNAAKYTERAGHIWLTAERRGGEAVVSVRDTGIGIAAEHLVHIFGLFSQVGTALDRSQGGLGIGLSLVKALVELHGGTIEAHSDGPGRGSEFIVRLPIVDVPVEAPQEPGSDAEKVRSGSKCRILVVDDLRDAADSLATMLQMMGHDTCTAFDGLEAIQAAATFKPNVVLLDIGLPKINGYEAARHIRNEPWGKEVALVALTGWGQEVDKQRSLEAGFDHHLTKPVAPATLEKLLALLMPQP